MKPSASEYISAVKDELSKIIDPQKTKLIIEPGSAIIGSAVDLCTSVLDVKDTNKSRIVTTDGSRIHIDPLWKKIDICIQYKLKIIKNWIDKLFVVIHAWIMIVLWYWIMLLN